MSTLKRALPSSLALPSWFKTTLQEPIIQFLLLGGALFLLHGLIRPPGAASGGEIVVSDARVATMVQTFMRTWQRPPTFAELDGLIEDHIRMEVYVREAMALGLDRDDMIVRRRLRQKMEFVSDAEASRKTPSEGDLQVYLSKHSDQYRTDTQVSFRHVFLNPEQRRDALNADARLLLERLNDPEAGVNALEVGDRLVMLKPEWQSVPKSELVALFGGEFTEVLLQQQLGTWVGPISSSYGMHLVKLDEMKPGDVPSLNQVRSKVERDWIAAQKRKQQKVFYRRLLGKYTVTRPELPEP